MSQPQCNFITKSGKRCSRRKNPVHGGYCTQHANVPEPLCVECGKTERDCCCKGELILTSNVKRSKKDIERMEGKKNQDLTSAAGATATLTTAPETVASKTTEGEQSPNPTQVPAASTAASPATKTSPLTTPTSATPATPVAATRPIGVSTSAQTPPSVKIVDEPTKLTPSATVTTPSGAGDLFTKPIPMFSSKFSRPVDDSPHLIVEARAGCLAADTIINVNRAGKGSEMTIEKLVRQFNGQGATYVRSDNGATQRMRPWNQDIPTMTARACGQTIRLGKIKNAWFSGMKETFIVTTDTGRNVRATAIHPFLTDKGDWLKLQDLKIGTMLQVNKGRSGRGRGPKILYPVVGCKFHPNQLANGDNRFKVAKHRAVVEAHMNGLTLREFCWIISHDEVAASKLTYLDRDKIVHHKNEDSQDWSLDNLEVLSSVKEHSDQHEWVNNVLWQVGFEEVISVEPYGMEPTYDIEVEDDPHNFLANGFVVHNTGKTTTLIEGLKRIKGVPTPGFVPSPQQQAVFDAMELSKGKVNSICFVAFNKSIAAELKSRVPAGCDASTMHGMGFKCVARNVKLNNSSAVNEDRVQNIIAEIMGEDIRELRRKEKTLVGATQKLVSLCKMNLVGQSPDWKDNPVHAFGWEDELNALASHYEVDLNGSKEKVFALVPQVLQRCLDVERDGYIDFDDMIFLPTVLSLPMPKYDLLLIDERQDLNKCQMQLALRAGRRIIAVGDEKQSIYGFAGADHNACRNFKTLLEGTGRPVMELPLTVTRRCGRAIVEEARKIVPDFHAHESNPEGKVSFARM